MSTTPSTGVASPTAAPLSTGLKIATIVFAALAAVGLVVTLILLFATIISADTEAFGWYAAFSVIASFLNVVPAIVALILGLVGRRTASRIPLVGIVIGAVVIVILVAQYIFLATV